MLATTAALAFFLPGAAVRSLVVLSQGHINDTLLATLAHGEKVILQRINATVFPDPDVVMTNMRRVTRHLARRTAAFADAPVFFRLLASPEGHDVFHDQDGHHWRLLSCIDHSRTLISLETLDQAREAGRLLGQFHLLTADLPLADLADPLPGFHCTPLYLDHFDQACSLTRAPSTSETFCLDFILRHRHCAGRIEQAKNSLRHQVIHGDPKLANFLFSQSGDQAVSLIDLDTVRPGLLLHDLGDCLRSCGNRRGEDHHPAEETEFDAAVFAALLSGYADQAGHLLAEADKALVVEAVKILCFELGLRFFTDHLEGNRYFRVNSPKQNLYRATVQFHLYLSIARQEKALKRTLAALFAERATPP